ncbi:MAG TPA: hypothetical protein VHG35_00195 [Gemmatimonadales bacterium]|nr:hypothetical protein [Gemmatimonadales bacterium]
MSALHTLLRDSIDYAGLFPPAGLGMAETVANYASYREGPQRWALGRLVVTATRLAELETVAEELLPPSPAPPWRVAALLGADPMADLEAIGELNCRHAAEGAGALTVDVVEGKAETPEAAERLLGQVPKYLQAYVEIPIGGDPTALAAAVGAAGGRLKVRTGGVTPTAFPAPADLLRFIRAAHDANVAFKATAGLHHPLRADYRLTYEPGSARGTMFGFLNLFLATALVVAGADDREAGLLLEERDPRAFRFDADAVAWRRHRLDLETIRRARESGVVSFGSCSFTEPIGDLQSLGLL